MPPIVKKTYSRKNVLKKDLSDSNRNNSDPFDKLLESPLKQPVDFKPLSYWNNQSESNLIWNKSATNNKCNTLCESENTVSVFSNAGKLKLKWKGLKLRLQPNQLNINAHQRSQSSFNNITNSTEKTNRQLIQPGTKNKSIKYENYDKPSTLDNSFQFVTLRRPFKKKSVQEKFLSDTNYNRNFDLKSPDTNLVLKNTIGEKVNLNKMDLNTKTFVKQVFNESQSCNNNHTYNFFNSVCNTCHCNSSFLRGHKNESSFDWESTIHQEFNNNESDNSNSIIVKGGTYRKFDLENSAEDKSTLLNNRCNESDCLFFEDKNSGHSSKITSLVDMMSDMNISNRNHASTVIDQVQEPFKTIEVKNSELLSTPNISLNRSSSVPVTPMLKNITTRRHNVNNKNKVQNSRNSTSIPVKKLCANLKVDVHSLCEENDGLNLSTQKIRKSILDSSCFPCSSPICESTRIFESRKSMENFETVVEGNNSNWERTIVLKPGKKWLRSISVFRHLQDNSCSSNGHMTVKGRNYQTFVDELIKMQENVQEKTINSISSYQLPNTTSVKGATMNHTIKFLKLDNSESASDFRKAYEFQNNVSVIYAENTIQKSVIPQKSLCLAKEIILRQCGQNRVLPFEEYFNERTLKDCKKIGEGVFGEVFMYNSDTVIKVIPIEGEEKVNGEPQKKFEEILSEIIIASKLSDLRMGDKNQTCGFSKMKKCWLVVGKYPKFLLDLWDDFNATGSGSENDSPEMFKSDQLYIILELENGGKCLESFTFNSAEQSFSIFLQTAFSLGAAEKAFEFEHRDLHWGNILISKTKDKYMTFVLDDVKFKIPTKGVKVSIIDFTLSRLSHEDCCVFNDLSVDPSLFASYGDYQFEIYRMMQKEVKDDWSVFKPKTNIYWLHYTLSKMLKGVRYKNKTTQIHKKFVKELKTLESIILKYDCCSDFSVESEYYEK